MELAIDFVPKRYDALNKCGNVKGNWFSNNGGSPIMKLNEKLHSYRKKSGLSQQELAEQLEVSIILR